VLLFYFLPTTLSLFLHPAVRQKQIHLGRTHDQF
jgi:hypothetical protein